MKQLNDYAVCFGIDMFPCIQTLAHLQQILKWNAYHHLQDVPGILLAEGKPTYDLLEKMIRSASPPFTSSRIHIGMDEAHGIGTGRYKDLYGERDKFDIFTAHLKRVWEICRKLKLRPMIWCDMYFRMASKNYDYYDTKFTFPSKLKENIQKDIQMVYWDYYHTDEKFYCDFIDRHRKLGVEPVVAGGIWTWIRFWAQLPYSFLATDAAMNACKRKEVREVFTTLWFDDGNDCDPFSALPGIQYFAEHGYAKKVNPRNLQIHFRGACEANFDNWVKAGSMDCVRRITSSDEPPLSITRGLLWDDPFLGLMDAQLDDFPYKAHYLKLADELDCASKEATLGSSRLRFPAAVVRAAGLKYGLRCDLLAAYKANDRKRLAKLARKDLKLVYAAVEKLWKEHRRMWMATYKPFGFEVVEGRYGALLARFDHLAECLDAYVGKTVQSIPELEAKHHRVEAKYKLGYHPDISYASVATATVYR